MYACVSVHGLRENEGETDTVTETTLNLQNRPIVSVRIKLKETSEILKRTALKELKNIHH